MSTSYTFCPMCGEKMGERKGIAQSCAECGFEYFHNPKFSASIIIENEKGEILLGLRAFEPKKGMWNVIGGFIDPQETAEEAAKREVREETGLNLKKVSYLGSYPDTYAYKGATYDLLALAFWARIDESEVPVAADDVSKLQFFKPSEVPFEDMGFPSDINQLKDYLEKRSAGLL